LHGSETTGDFLSKLHHSDVTFSLIVVEWDRKVVHERQNLLVVAEEAHHQISSVALFDATAFTEFFAFGVFFHSPCNNLAIALFEVELG